MTSTMAAADGVRRRGHRSRPAASLGLLPFFAFTGFFLGWPLVSVINRSLHDNYGEWTLGNYRPLLHGQYLTAFSTSARLALFSAVIGAVIGGFLAYLIVTTAGPSVAKFFDGVSAVLANSGGVPLAFMFIAAFGTNGFAIRVLRALGWDLYSGRWTLFSFSGLVLVYCFFQIPLMVIVFNPAVKGLRKEWSEASQSLGASESTYWRQVAIPILLPSFLGAVFLLFAGGFSAYATARAMTVGTTPLVPLLIGNLVDGNVIANQANLGDALAVAMIIVAGVAMLCYGVAQRYAGRWRSA